MTDRFEPDAAPAGFEGWVPLVGGLVVGTTIYTTSRAALAAAQEHALDAKLEVVVARVSGTPHLHLIDCEAERAAAALGEYNKHNGG